MQCSACEVDDDASRARLHVHDAMDAAQSSSIWERIGIQSPCPHRAPPTPGFGARRKREVDCWIIFRGRGYDHDEEDGDVVYATTVVCPPAKKTRVTSSSVLESLLCIK